MNDILGKRIRRARKEKQLNQRSLARKIDVASRTLQRWEKGEQVPDSIYLLRLAQSIGVRPEWLLTGDGDMLPQSMRRAKVIPLRTERLISGIDMVQVPVFASVPAGKTAAMFHPEHTDRYVTVDNIRDPNAFALVVKGNSMSPKIEDADIVVVSPRHEARSGDICVIRVNDEDVLKKIKIEGSYIHLIPLNPTFETVTVRREDVSFLWKVVKVIKSL